MIELRNITKSYGSLTVLHDVTLSVEDGEILSIVGPSGAGKTTLLHIAGTLDRPDSGYVTFDGTDPFKMKDKKLSAFRNSNIGFVFQFHRLLPEFSAVENVALPALIRGVKKKKAFEEARKLLEELGLGDRLRHKPAEMSGGERQRAAIARALINSPKVIFADEPTGSLDSKNRDEIKEIIISLNENRGQTFVLVTHDPTMAEIASRVVTMADGEIIKDTAKDTITDPVDEISKVRESEVSAIFPIFAEESGEITQSSEDLETLQDNINSIDKETIILNNQENVNTRKSESEQESASDTTSP